MYFNQNNKFYHGIMFHHFHDNVIHTKGQGSIDKDDFYKMINFIGRNNILDTDVFYEKFKNNSLKDNEVCLSFDDAIKCQIDIAFRDSMTVDYEMGMKRINNSSLEIARQDHVEILKMMNI